MVQTIAGYDCLWRRPFNKNFPRFWASSQRRRNCLISFVNRGYCHPFPATLCACFLVVLNSCAGEPSLNSNALPHIPPVESTNALKTFQLKKGFHLQLVASEPLVMDPIAMCFDENGRLFVVEMRDYSEMREMHPHLGRIRMLEDTNGDGEIGRAHV